MSLYAMTEYFILTVHVLAAFNCGDHLDDFSSCNWEGRSHSRVPSDA